MKLGINLNRESVILKQIIKQLGFPINEGGIICEGRDFTFNEESKYILNIQQQELNVANKHSKIPFCDKLKFELLEQIVNLGHPIPRVSFYPSGKKACLVLTHDVEWEYTINELINRFLPIEESLGFRSTLFVRPVCADYGIKKIRLLLEESITKGHEIGTHGDNDGKDYYSHLSFEHIKREKEIMKSLNLNVKGVGNHGGFFLKRNWSEFEKAGYSYSRNKITQENLGGGKGFSYGTAWPWFPVIKSKQKKILEIYGHFQEGIWIDHTNEKGVQTLAGLTKPINLLCSGVEKHLEELLETGSQYNSAVCVIFHPEDFCDPKQISTIYHNFLIEAKNRKYWVTTAGELEKWWRRRMDLNLDVDYNGKDLQIYSQNSSGFTIEIMNIEKVENLFVNEKRCKPNKTIAL